MGDGTQDTGIIELDFGIQPASGWELGGWRVSFPWQDWSTYSRRKSYQPDLLSVISYLEFALPAQYYHRTVRRVGGIPVPPMYPRTDTKSNP